MFSRPDGRRFRPTSAAYSGIAVGYGKLTNQQPARVVTADGGDYLADLVIGADGARSTEIAAVLIGLVLIRTSLRLVKRSHDFLVGVWQLTPRRESEAVYRVDIVPIGGASA